MPSSSSVRLLIINPNSSQVVTDALAASLAGSLPSDVAATFFTPSSGPEGIKDPETAAESTRCCWGELVGEETDTVGSGLAGFDAVLLACFSEHPLIAKLQAHLRPRAPAVVVLGMCTAGFSHALLLGERFGIAASGFNNDKPNLPVAVANFLGSPSSARYVGLQTVELGIVEIQTGDRAAVEEQMKRTGAILAAKGADVVVLGCAAMSGLDAWVVEGGRRAGKEIKVVDGATAGVQLLLGLVRSRQ